MSVRVRFAPSPSGRLHVGNARTALFNWLFARHEGGVLVLRVEDTDKERSDPSHEKSLCEELRWLGIVPAEGPLQGGDHGPYRQSERGDRYSAALSRLLESGDAYRCFCTEEDLEAARAEARKFGRAFTYPGTCRDLPSTQAQDRVQAGEACTVRLSTLGAGTVRFNDRIQGSREIEAATFGDIVLARSDGSATYNLAVVVDDAAMKITHVIRGDDHLPNTPKQILIYRALEVEPPEFAHVPLVTGADGKPLSKREGGASLEDWRVRGYPAAAVANALCLLGWGHPEGRDVFDLAEAARRFEIDRVHASPASFDREKLHWLAGRHMAHLTGQELVRGLADLDLLPGPLADLNAAGADWLAEACRFFADGAHTLVELAERGALLWSFEPAPLETGGDLLDILESGRPVLEAFATASAPLDLTDPEALAGLKKALSEATGLKGGAIMKPLRVALTGAMSGPELSGFLPMAARGGALGLVPGPEERVRRALERLGV